MRIVVLLMLAAVSAFGQEIFDVIIVGAGPAGLQLAQQFSSFNLSYIVLERSAGAGSFFAKFPRHRQLISINKVHTGSDDPEFSLRHDWNSLLSDDPSLLFPRYSQKLFPEADLMVSYLADFSEKLQLKIVYNANVETISKTKGIFSVSTSPFLSEGERDKEGGGGGGKRKKGEGVKEYRGRNVIMASGLSKPFVPKAEGIELAVGYENVDISPHLYTNKRVLILGKGNSAFEVANGMMDSPHLIHLVSAHPLRFAYETHFPGDLRSINAAFLDTYQLKSQNAMIEIEIGEGDGMLVNTSRGIMLGLMQEDGEIINPSRTFYDVVIRALGFAFEDSMFDKKLKFRKSEMLRGRYPLMDSDFQSPTVPGLYFAGTNTAVMDGKKSSASFIHGFRYLCRFLARTLREKIQKVPFPSKVVPATPAGLTSAFLGRAQRTSGLYQMFHFLADVAVVENVEKDGKQDKQIVYYEEMPILYALERFAGKDLFLLTLEYHEDFGKAHRGRESVWGEMRVHPRLTPAAGEESNFIHPVVRYFSGSNPYREDWMKATPPDAWEQRANAQHHVMEDVLFDFSEQERHVEPMMRFFAGLLYSRPELAWSFEHRQTCAAAGGCGKPEIPVPQNFLRDSSPLVAV